MSAPLEVIGTISKWVNAILIKFTGGTGENEIQIPDDLASALDVTEAGNSYLDFVTTDGSELVKLGKDMTITGNYAVEGQTTAKNVLRSFQVSVEPGFTANTNLKILSRTSSGWTFNLAALTDADGSDDANSLGKSETEGSFTLSANGNALTVNISETATKILSVSMMTHDINSSSTSEMYCLYAEVSAGDIQLHLKKRGASASTDWTTLMDAGDFVYAMVTFITSD